MASGVSNTTAAAIGATTAVGASVINRAITGDCYAMCSNGWHCDRESGLCRENSPQRAATVTAPPKPNQEPADPPEPEASAEPVKGAGLPSVEPEASAQPGMPAGPESAKREHVESTATNDSGGTACRPPFRCALESTK